MNSPKGQNRDVPTAAINPAKRRLSEVYGLTELIGQAECVRTLRAFGDLYASRNSVPDHILLTGADGMGKTRVAQAFAKTYAAGLRELNAKGLKRLGDLTASLTCMDPNELLFLSNVQELRNKMLDCLQIALQKSRIDLIIGARIHPYQLNRFTLIATAPRTFDVPPELLKCFSLSIPLQPYSILELKSIALSLAKENGVNLSEGAAHLVASVAQGNPGNLDQLVRRLSRLGKTGINEAEATQALSAFGLTPRTASSFGVALNTDNMGTLTGVEFEKMITSLLQRMGFKAEMTRTTGDGGIDIVAYLERPFVGGRYLIQCKRFAQDTMIGAPLVREFYGACVADRKAIEGIFITTSAFTPQAHEFADNLPLELIDGDRLNRLLAEYPSGLPSIGAAL